MIRFKSYKSWLAEEFVDYAKSLFLRNPHIYEILKNPYPHEVHRNIRAIGDQDGNLWVAKIAENEDFDYAVHEEIVDMVNSIGYRLSYPYSNYNTSIAFERLMNTDIFALGESYNNPKTPPYSEDEMMEYNYINKKIANKIKEKNPQWRFIFKRIDKLTNEDIEGT